MKLQVIRSATIRLTYLGHLILIDPYFAEKYSRPSFAGKSKNPLVDLPLSISEIMSGVEMVLVSHLHSDHFDKAAQDIIAKSIPIACQAEDEAGIRKMGFENVYSITEKFNWEGIQINRILGKHGDGDVLKEMGIASGFLFEASTEPDIFWCGDTVLCEKVRKVLLEKKPGIVITHSCGAVWGDNVKIVMDEIQTIEICKMLPDSIVIAAHMDSVDHATVSREQLRNYAKQNGIRDDQLIIPSDGEVILFDF